MREAGIGAASLRHRTAYFSSWRHRTRAASTETIPTFQSLPVQAATTLHQSKPKIRARQRRKLPLAPPVNSVTVQRTRLTRVKKRSGSAFTMTCNNLPVLSRPLQTHTARHTFRMQSGNFTISAHSVCPNSTWQVSTLPNQTEQNRTESSRFKPNASEALSSTDRSSQPLQSPLIICAQSLFTRSRVGFDVGNSININSLDQDKSSGRKTNAKA